MRNARTRRHVNEHEHNKKKMRKRGIRESVKHMLWTVAWMHCTSVGHGGCAPGSRGTVIGLRETVELDEVRRVGRELTRRNYSNVRIFPNLRMASGCGGARVGGEMVRGIVGMEWAEEDGRVEAGSWALDRLDQEHLPLDNRVYDAAGCVGRDGDGVEAFVIDTGCDVTHEVFRGRRIRSIGVSGEEEDGVDDNGHGSAIASLMNGRGVGVAAGMRVTCIKALDRNGVGVFSDVVQGLLLVNFYVRPRPSFAVPKFHLTPAPSPCPALRTARTEDKKVRLPN